MIIEIICLISAVSLSVAGSLTFWKINQWYEFYKAIVLVIGGYLGGLILALILILIASLFFQTKKPSIKFSKPANFLLCQGIQYLKIHGHAKVEWKGVDKMPKNERFLVIGNHRSNWDSMFMSLKFKNKEIAYISKPSNMKNPFIGRFAHNMCYQSIDKNDLMQSLGVIKHSIELIENNICSIGVFPEGKRQHDKPVIDFHEGVFNIALKSKCPIVVVCTKNSEKVYKFWPFNWRNNKVIVEIVGVIPYEEISSLTAKAVSDMVHNILEEKMLSK